MRVSVTLLLLLCATPVGSAFGLIGGGGVCHASESFRCARHDCSGPHAQQGTGSGLPTRRGAFAFASRRISYVHPSVVTMTKSRNSHFLRAASEELVTSEGERAKLLEERKEQLRVLLSATEKEIDNLVRTNPTILNSRDAKKTHGPKLNLLQKRLDMSKNDASRLCLMSCRLLKTSLATLENKMDWLQARLNINKSQLRTIVERVPNVLAYSIDDNLEPTIDNIQFGLELSDKELTNLVVSTPEVLTQCADNMTQRIPFLQKMLDLPEGDTGTLQKKCIKSPPLLFWLEESMLDSQKWIQERFGLVDAKIAQMCRNRPELLFSNTTTLNNKADSIQADLSLTDDELSGLVSKFPTILGFSIEKKIRPKLRYLRVRFELDEDALKDLLLKAPSLFGLADDTIEKKLQFYSNIVGEREAKRLVIKSNNLLKVSLEKRLKPRLEEVEKSGVKVRWNETLIQRLARRRNETWEAYGLGVAKRGGPKEYG